MSKRVTLKQVAARAGVSYQTVSKVINGHVGTSEATAKRIRQAVDELGYRPHHIARSLRSQRTRTIGYSWSNFPADQPNPILNQLLQSMLYAAESRDYYLLSFPFFEDQGYQTDSYGMLFDTRRVDGFIISSVEYDDPRASYLIDRKIPFVAFGRSNPDWEFPYIDVDGSLGLAMATEHLLEQGHRRIAILAWPEESRIGTDRLAGYLQAMEANGIIPLEHWIARGESCFEFGLEASRRWLQSPRDQRPTAILALNDSMAIGAMNAANEAGLQIGPDLSIVGFDDAPLVRYLSPPLSSVRQPTWEVGERVIEMMIAVLEGEPLAENQILLPPELIIRESSLGYLPE